MGLFWRSGDGVALGCLLAIAALFGAMSHVAYTVLHSRHITPLGSDAPTDRFSEARAIEHVRYLSEEIHGRQEGKPGLQEAARYIRRQLENLAERAGPEIRVDIEENLVSGSFKMKFLRHSLSLCYRNHTNIVMRIQSANSGDNDPALLVNGHFDGPLGSPAAGDCGSCVASMLELVRLIIDSHWIPPYPLVFLFNGAEELFLLGSHGFLTTHKYAANIGAFINIEASGTGGPDLVCQSGPGSWPSLIYAQSAVHPMGQSAAQDVFGIIPGDTDYRIFAQDFGKIPGLDIIFVLGGYFYHTSYDTVDRLLPGSMQARGDNIYNLIKAFTSSPLLQAAQQRPFSVKNEKKDERAVYFDYLSLFMIFYSRRVSLFLHSMPAVIFFLLPLFLHFHNITARLWYATFLDLMKGMVCHTAGIMLAVSLPVVFAISRLLLSDRAMTWFAHPYLAFLMFVPCSVVGLLIPRALCGVFSISQHSSSLKKTKEELFDEACFWGAFGVYGFVTLAYLIAGLGGGFLACWLSWSMMVAWFFFCFTCKHFGCKSLKSFAGYVIPLMPILIYAVYFCGFLVQFVIEKMGMMGALALPYGYFVPDIIVAAIVGIATALCMGPLVPVVSHWLARLSVIQLLLQVTVVTLALSSQFFPYSKDAPKRVVLQHTFLTTDTTTVVESNYEFSVVDANSLLFLFKHAPDASKLLKIDHQATSESLSHSDQSSMVASFPVSFLFSGSLKFPDQNASILEHYRFLPQLYMVEVVKSQMGSRKIQLELYLGSLEEVWVTVLNITGPLSNWSFSDNKLPEPEAINGGPPSYICRLSGVSHENWTFWVEANNSDPLRIDVAVLDQYLLDSTKRLKNVFPDWADVVSFSSFLSSYYF